MVPPLLGFSASQKGLEDDGQCSCRQHGGDLDPGLPFVHGSGARGFGFISYTTTILVTSQFPTWKRNTNLRMTVSRPPLLAMLALGLSLFLPTRPFSTSYSEDEPRDFSGSWSFLKAWMGCYIQQLTCHSRFETPSAYRCLCVGTTSTLTLTYTLGHQSRRVVLLP